VRSDFSIQNDDKQEVIMLPCDNGIDEQSFDHAIKDEYDELFDNMEVVDNKCEEQNKKRKHVQERSSIDRDVNRFEMVL